MRHTACVWFAAATIVAAGCSKNDTTKAASEHPPATTKAVGTSGTAGDIKNDGDFVHDVAIMNLTEIELSRMAAARATSPEVKSFAQRLVDDHGAAGEKLKSAVAGQSIEWPAQLDDKHKEIADELAKKHGGDFDHEYLKAMIAGHQDVAAKLESRLDVQSLADWNTAAAARTQSHALPEPKAALRDVPIRPDKSDSAAAMKINQWAADTYPTVQKHLDTARTLENAIKKRSTN